MISVLLISGSAREGSTNVAVLRTAAAVVAADVDAVLFGAIGALPLFNPDDDREGVPADPRVTAMRDAVAAADALLFSTPEYAGALPAALKNLLEWTIGDAGTYRKPVAWINAAGPRRRAVPPMRTSRSPRSCATPAPRSSTTPASGSRSRGRWSVPTA